MAAPVSFSRWLAVYCSRISGKLPMVRQGPGANRVFARIAEEVLSAAGFARKKGSEPARRPVPFWAWLTYNEFRSQRTQRIGPALVWGNDLGDAKMPITITLEDGLLTELADRAKKQQLSVEQLVIRILTEAMAASDRVTLREAVARVQVTPPNLTQVRPATADLGDLLRAAPGDPCFDLESWKRQWSDVEAEMKAITRANDIAEGRGRSD
jgi:hypothetical protein